MTDYNIESELPFELAHQLNFSGHFTFEDEGHLIELTSDTDQSRICGVAIGPKHILTERDPPGTKKRIGIVGVKVESNQPANVAKRLIPKITCKHWSELAKTALATGNTLITQREADGCDATNYIIRLFENPLEHDETVKEMSDILKAGEEAITLMPTGFVYSDFKHSFECQPNASGDQPSG